MWHGQVQGQDVGRSQPCVAKSTFFHMMAEGQMCNSAGGVGHEGSDPGPYRHRGRVYIDLLGDEAPYNSLDGLRLDDRTAGSLEPQGSGRSARGVSDGSVASDAADYPPNAQAPACPPFPSALCAKKGGDASASVAPWLGPGGLDAALHAQENEEDAGKAKDPMPWDAGVWTVMIRQVPKEYSQSMLVKEVNKRGYEGLWDFFYLPHDFRKGYNVGFGFMSFIDPRHALAFRHDFDNTYLNERTKNSGRPLRIHPAKVQGYEANYRHFRQTQAGQWTDPNFSPLFLPRGGPGEALPGQFPGLQGFGVRPPLGAFSRGKDSAQGRAAEHWKAPLRVHPQLQRASACQACGQALPPEYNYCGRCGARVSSRRFDAKASAQMLQDFAAERQRLLMELVIVEAKAASAQQSLCSCQVTPSSALSTSTGGTQFGVVTGQNSMLF